MTIEGQQMLPDTPFEVSVAVRSTEVGQETVVFDILRDKCYRLNATGTLVWQLLTTGTSLERVAEQLASEYRLEKAAASLAAEEFLQELVNLGLAASSSTVDTKF